MRRVGILISGGGSNMVSLVRSMKDDSATEPGLVLSNVPDAIGLDKASELGVKTQSVDSRSYGADRAAFEVELTKRLLDAGIDLICLAGFMRLLTPAFVTKWQGQLLNIHPSLLPKFKGLNTHTRAIEAGETEHGCTVHEVTAALDGGPILGQAKVPVLTNDTAKDLAARVLEKEHLLYPAVLKKFAVGDKSPIMIG